MTWWRKASPTDTGSHNINGWIKIQSIWRKASSSDEANSNASSNPWVIDGWLKIKSAWRHEGGGIWTKIFSSIGLPVPKIPFSELYFIWPDTFLTIDAPINGSKMFATRGSWTEEPNEFRIRIQEKAPGGTWTAIYDTTTTYTEYLDSDSTDRFPSNANDTSRPVITKTKTREGYQFRTRVDATNPDNLTNFYETTSVMPKMDFYINTFTVYNETSNGGTFNWTFAASQNGNTVNDLLDIYSQKIYVYDELNNLILTQPVSVGSTTYTLSSQLLSPNVTYNVELEIIGQDGYATSETPTYSFEYVNLTTILNKPEIITYPTLTLQSGVANKRNSVYRLSSGSWSNNPTQYRYIIELNNQSGTQIAYYPSSTTYTTETYYDHTFLNLTSSTVSGVVIANNGVPSLPAYSSNTVGPITELEYTITYNGNGGTPGRSSDLVAAGNSVNLPSASKSYATFDGWYTAQTGGTFVGNANTLYSPTQNITLYARWTDIQYTVSWNANGGSVSPTSNSGIFGTNVIAPTPTRAEYDFFFWRHPLSGDIDYQVNAGAPWTINGTLTFYAVWTIKQYTVTYNEGGGSNVNDVTVNSGSQIQLPSTSRDGYTLDGWYSAPTGGTFLGNPGSNYTVTGNVTLYARWTIITYTVTWNANGGSVNPTSSTGTLGQSVTAPTPTRAGHTFQYWRNPSAGDLLYTVYAGNSWTINGSIIFTAVWSVNNYTVFYNEQGGSNTNDPTVSYGSTVTLPSTSRTGYTLNGWYTASSGGSFVGNPGSSYTVYSDVILYAQWTAITYTVSWDANGGSVSPTSNSGTYGSSVTAPTPTRSLYTFNYWRYPSAGDMLYTLNAGNQWTINGTITFYAVWTIQQYTVTFNANGGSVSPASSSTNAGSSVTLPTPSRTGYTFNGWYTASSGGTYLGSGGNTYTPSSSVTIYAQWTVIQYTITWNANGGTGGGTTTRNAGSTHTAPSAPTRSGYTFNGWYDTPSGDYLYNVAAGGTFTPDRTMTFYARWTQNLQVPGAPASVSISRNQSTWNGTQWSWSASWTAPTTGGPVDYYEAYREVGTGTVGNASLTSVNHTSNTQTPINGTTTTFTTATQANNRADAYVRACNSAGCGLWRSGNVG